MRKTSQDGGDNTSITSGVENEIKKPIVGIMKTKRNSIKRKVQNFSHDSDDAVVEPLLHKDKTETPNQSAKCLLPKTKTECEKGNDRDKLLSDDRVEKPLLSAAPSVYGNTSIPNGTKKLYENSSTIHNHMNTNVFSNFDDAKKVVVPKSQILVEIDGNKPTGYNPSPLIFTTAKIHTDIKTKTMAPVQVTPVPILSISEGSVQTDMDKKITEVCDEGNNMVNIKNYETEFKGLKNAKPSTTVSEIAPYILSTENSFKRNVGMDLDIVAASGSNLLNKPINSVEINNISKNTEKCDFNKVTINSLESKIPLNIGTKYPYKTNASIVDVNKNIEANKIVTSSDCVVDCKKQLPNQKCSVELNSISDKNIDSIMKMISADKSVTESKNGKSPLETNLEKTNNGKTNYLIKSISVSKSANSTSGSPIKNETTSKIPTTASIVESPCTSITPTTNISTESSLVSGVSTTTVATKNMVSNVISEVKPPVSDKISCTQATSDTSSLMTSSSQVKSTAIGKTPTSKPSAVKTISVTTSIKTKPSQSALVNVATMPASGANTFLKTVKPTDSQSSNMKSNNQTISTNIESIKSLNRPHSTAVSSSSASSSIISSVKKQDSTNQIPKSTTSGLKSSTSTIISKPGTLSTTQTSFTGKQTPTKIAPSKSSNSTVKTLITSNDRPSSSGSVKKITSTKSQNKQIESKGNEINKKV